MYKNLVSVPLRGLVVFNNAFGRDFTGYANVSVPLRGLVVFNQEIKFPEEYLQVSVPLRGLVVFNTT